MERRIAYVISYVSHPIFLPIYLLGIVLNIDALYLYIMPLPAKWLIMGMIVLATAILPLMLMLLFYRTGIIGSLRAETREKRNFPYVMMSVLYGVLYFLFKSANIPGVLAGLIFGIFVLLVMTLLVNFRWKISIHMAATGGVAGAFLALSFRYFVDLRIAIVIAILLAGLVGFARLKLHAHTAAEVYAGWLVGIAVMFVTLVYY
jgi:hypothetical protein